MDESFAGFRTRGGWVDIVEHGERVTRALREEGVPEERLERFAEWRPKANERLGEDVEEKTAEQGVVPEGETEETAPDEAADTAGDATAEKSPADDGEGLSGSVEDTARTADSVGRKALRVAERTVYRTVMRKTAPYYFNADLLSASIERGRGDAPYVFEVTIKDQDLKNRVSERLREYENEVERWHVDTEKRTESLEAAEGADPDAADDPGANADIDTDFHTT